VNREEKLKRRDRGRQNDESEVNVEKIIMSVR
jgi:hypothetical protein